MNRIEALIVFVSCMLGIIILWKSYKNFKNTKRKKEKFIGILLQSIWKLIFLKTTGGTDTTGFEQEEIDSFLISHDFISKKETKYNGTFIYCLLEKGDKFLSELIKEENIDIYYKKVLKEFWAFEDTKIQTDLIKEIILLFENYY